MYGTFTAVLQLEANYAGETLEPGEFGGHSLYRELGYYSLIGLLRLHTQLGDYYQALQSVANVQLSKKVRGEELSWVQLACLCIHTSLTHPFLTISHLSVNLGKSNRLIH